VLLQLPWTRMINVLTACLLLPHIPSHLLDAAAAYVKEAGKVRSCRHVPGLHNKSSSSNSSISGINISD
jgi:hypothetical protein